MKSLFNRSASEEMVKRITGLTNGSTRQWGKMSVGQMAAHCAVALEVAVGDKTQKRSLASILFGRIAKKQLFTDKPFKQGLPTDKLFVMHDEKELENEKKRLVSVVNRFSEMSTGGVTKEPHPFFGNLTPDEWGTLMWKHLDHHLRQFGA